MLCGEVAFLKEGRLVGRGRIPDLQQRLGLGDHLSLVFQDRPAPLDYGRLPGVLSHTVQDSRVDLVLDRAETACRPSWRPCPSRHEAGQGTGQGSGPGRNLS